jgi:hypothetical protein
MMMGTQGLQQTRLLLLLVFIPNVDLTMGGKILKNSEALPRFRAVMKVRVERWGWCKVALAVGDGRFASPCTVRDIVF